MQDKPTIAGFPITAEVRLVKSGTHMDIGYEISNHARDTLDFGDPTYKRRIPTRGTYCYYIFVSEQMLPADQFADFWLSPNEMIRRSSGAETPCYDYDSPGWASADWHCGVTWYSKESGFDGEPRRVKIGCDYNHYWDEGNYYTLESVTRDATSTIDALRQMYSFYRRDPYNGKWLPASEMVEHEGVLYSPDGLEQRLKMIAEWEAKKEAAA